MIKCRMLTGTRWNGPIWSNSFAKMVLEINPGFAKNVLDLRKLPTRKAFSPSDTKRETKISVTQCDIFNLLDVVQILTPIFYKAPWGERRRCEGV